jgi:hypothetical protein
MSRESELPPTNSPSPATSSAVTAGDSQNRLAQAYDCLGLLVPPFWGAKLAAIATIDSLRRNVPASVAQMTGGDLYMFDSTRGLEQAFMNVSNHIPNRYLLSFQPQNPHPGLHAISLHLANYPNLLVTARHGYWADQPGILEVK